MKLPKPGKNRTPKPEKKKIQIRNRFLQKNLFSLIVIAVLAIGTGTAYGTLSSKGANHGNDPVNGVNQDRYQVLVSGEGFKLSKKQEKDYKLQKKQNEVNAANAAQTPKTIRSSSGSRTFRSGSSHHYKSSYHNTFKTSKNPRISSNITDQISMESSWKAGDSLKFRVSAFAYPYGTKNAISAEDIKISVEVGQAAELYKTKGGYNYYSVELGEGKNKITITATDKKNKKTAKLGPYIVKAGAGSSGSNTDPTQGSDTPADEEINLPVTASVDLSDLGLGTVTFDGIVVKKDTTAYDVLSKIDGIKMKGQEIEYISGDMGSFSLDGSSKAVQNIYRKVCNLSDDEVIEEGEFATWLGETEDIVKESGKLGTDYPFTKTKWTFDNSKTGEELANSGITLTLILYDGI